MYSVVRISLCVHAKWMQCSGMRVYACVCSWACLSRVYIMLLDGKVLHVAANIVTVVSVRVHTSGNSSSMTSDKCNGTH